MREQDMADPVIRSRRTVLPGDPLLGQPRRTLARAHGRRPELRRLRPLAFAPRAEGARLRRGLGRDLLPPARPDGRLDRGLAGPGVVKLAEIDTANLLFNAPAEVSLSGTADGETWFELLPRTRLQPDTPHRFRIEDAPVATHVRVDIHPDGGLARVRLHGFLSGA